MSTLSVDSINGQTVASKVSIPGHIVNAQVSQITANSSRTSAQNFADDFVFANYTPKLTTSTVIIQGIANFDSDNTRYCGYRWVINGANFLSTGTATPLYTHQFYSGTSMNNYGYMPSTIITSVSNTDGSAITVKCQGATNAGTLYLNRSANNSQSGSPSSVLYLEIAP